MIHVRETVADGLSARLAITYDGILLHLGFELVGGHRLALTIGPDDLALVVAR